MSGRENVRESSTGRDPSAVRRGRLGILSIVLGCLGLLLSFAYYWDIFYHLAPHFGGAFAAESALLATILLLGVAALVVALVGLHRQERRPRAFVGLILGLLALGLAIVPTTTTIKTYVTNYDYSQRQSSEFVVIYTASVADGSATVVYDDSDGRDGTEQFSGTWSKEVVIKGSGSAITVALASLPGSASESKKTCEIKVNGQVVSQESGTLDDVACHALLS